MQRQGEREREKERERERERVGNIRSGKEKKREIKERDK
jgi:hypothetical protein